MHEIDAQSAAAYLKQSGRFPNEQAIHVQELSGGVSNIVLRVEPEGEPAFVIKQCRERLRVVMEWFAPLERIWTECAALRMLGDILPAGSVPVILFEDRDNYLFAMTCAPPESVTWKSLLMDGHLDPAIATNLGTILGTIHAASPAHPITNTTLADTTLFTELRIDPYYRTTAKRHPAIAPQIESLIADMNRPPADRTLVLGDFSPKNILVHNDGLILLDFECAHAGDPAFDLGFFLTHLLLKAMRAETERIVSFENYLDLTVAFWPAYLERRSNESFDPDPLIRRACLHTAACCLSRVDGKSPVEYLDEEMKCICRGFAHAVLTREPASWADLLNIFVGILD